MCVSGMPACLSREGTVRLKKSIIDVECPVLLHEMIASRISKLLDYFSLAIGVGS